MEGKQNSGVGRAVLAIIIIVAILWIAPSLGGTSSGSTRSVPSNDNTARMACVMAEGFVKDRLVAPSTAKFPNPGGADCKASRRGNTWTVASFVDAQNSFGAMMRSDYAAQLSTDTQGEKWRLEDIAIVGR